MKVSSRRVTQSELCLLKINLAAVRKMDWRETRGQRKGGRDSQQSRQKAVWALSRAWAEGLGKTALIYDAWQKRINPLYLVARDSQAPKTSLSGAINRTRAAELEQAWEGRAPV